MNIKLIGAAVAGFGAPQPQETPLDELTVNEDAKIPAITGVHIVAPPGMSVRLGSSPVLKFRVINKGTAPGSYSLVVHGNWVSQAGINPPVSGTLNLPPPNDGKPGEALVEVPLQIPAALPGGSGMTEVKLMVRNVANGLMTDTGVVVVTAGSADLALTAVGSAATVMEGKLVTHTLRVSNLSIDGAQDVTLKSMRLPDTAILRTVSASQGTCDGLSHILCRLGMIEANKEAVVTMTIIPTVAGALTNQIHVGARTLDPNELNNATSVVTRVAGSPRLSANVEGAPVRTDGNVSVQLRLTNDGSGPALDVSLRSIIARVLAGTGTAAVLTPVMPYSIGQLETGESRLIPIQLAIGAGVTRISLTESGTLHDEFGATTSFSIAAAVAVP
jgi:hypothetical protein